MPARTARPGIQVTQYKKRPERSIHISRAPIHNYKSPLQGSDWFGNRYPGLSAWANMKRTVGPEKHNVIQEGDLN